MAGLSLTSVLSYYAEKVTIKLCTYYYYYIILYYIILYYITKTRSLRQKGPRRELYGAVEYSAGLVGRQEQDH